MKKDHIKYLVCPDCSGKLSFSEINEWNQDIIKEGALKCTVCGSAYIITRYVPRFVPLENYAAGFGFEWNLHAKTQYDSYSETTISEERFFQETKWSQNLNGQVILEVGSGSGRFTEKAASTGAMVVSIDYSCGVDANYNSNGKKGNVLIVQGDLYSMPFKKCFFDKLFCFGVLQHTPNVEKAFFCLPEYLKSGGSLVVDVYRLMWWTYLLVTQRWIRPLTKRLPPKRLYKIIKMYVNFMWPVVKRISKLPMGKYINRNLLLIIQYNGIFPLTEELQKQWAILDTFDCLSPIYDKPQSLRTVIKWFNEAKLKKIEVHYGYNGIEGRGQKP
jgi:SAM-dependent methyltransferase